MRRFAVLAFALTITVLAVGLKAAQNAPAPAGGGAPAAAGDIVTLEGTTLKGSISQGKLHYTFGNTSCTNCHGLNAVGAFGKELAGRNLTYEYVHNAIRNGSPTGMMPAFDDANVTDQEIADLVLQDSYAGSEAHQVRVLSALDEAKNAIVMDYKTGKRKPTEQLDLYAAYVFHHYPDVQEVTTVFVWLKEKKLDKKLN